MVQKQEWAEELSLNQEATRPKVALSDFLDAQS
jgi:hypothetical protein